MINNELTTRIRNIIVHIYRTDKHSNHGKNEKIFFYYNQYKIENLFFKLSKLSKTSSEHEKTQELTSFIGRLFTK